MLFNGIFLHFWDFFASRYSVLLLFLNPLLTRAQEKPSSWAAWSPVDPSKHMTEECLNHWVFSPQNTIGKNDVQATILLPVYQPDDKNVCYTLQLVTSGDVSRLDVLVKGSLRCRRCWSRAVHTPLTATRTYLNAELSFLTLLNCTLVSDRTVCLGSVGSVWSPWYQCYWAGGVCWPRFAAWLLGLSHKDPNLSCAVSRKFGYLTRGWIYAFLWQWTCVSFTM